jgi:mono/diheme cytochrome c family protein
MQERSRKFIYALFILALALPVATLGWAKGKKTALSPAAQAGKKLFDQNCTMCHFADQTTNKIGPGLKGLFKMKELPFSHRPVTDANVREQIEKGNPQGKPMPMPPFGGKLSATEMSNLIAYLKTL